MSWPTICATGISKIISACKLDQDCYLQPSRICIQSMERTQLSYLWTQPKLPLKHFTEGPFIKDKCSIQQHLINTRWWPPLHSWHPTHNNTLPTNCSPQYMASSAQNWTTQTSEHSQTRIIMPWHNQWFSHCMHIRALPSEPLTNQFCSLFSTLSLRDQVHSNRQSSWAIYQHAYKLIYSYYNHMSTHHLHVVFMVRSCIIKSLCTCSVYG